MSKTVRFIDFWNGFNPISNYEPLFKKIIEKYGLILIKEGIPDILFFSIFGEENKSLHFENCQKFFYSGEVSNHIKSPSVEKLLADGVIILGLDKITHPHFYRLPIIVRRDFFLTKGIYELDHDLVNLPLKKVTWDEKYFGLKRKKNPCERKNAVFIYSNPEPQERIRFAKKFMARMPLDCPGSVLNNITLKNNKRNRDMHKIASNYKFYIAFENQRYPGYFTEKIWSAFLGSSVPIYWGDPEIHDDFYKGSFINRMDFENDESCIDYIEFLNSNDTEYLKILNSPKVKNHSLFSYSQPFVFLDKFLLKDKP